MKIKGFITIFLIVILITISKAASKSKSPQSRFEIKYKECRKGLCSKREIDESCVLKCISMKCYNIIYENYILEFGEANYEKKSEFENCFNKN